MWFFICVQRGTIWFAVISKCRLDSLFYRCPQQIRYSKGEVGKITGIAKLAQYKSFSQVAAGMKQDNRCKQ